ncbi:MAG TPA: phosphoethanolamine transferase [Methylophilaceae bacterium]|nr:phosphoethanolamine transferase [Methylophilaceae bacterium]
MEHLALFGNHLMKFLTKQYQLILVYAFSVAGLFNIPLFQKLFDAYDLSLNSILFSISLWVVIGSLNAFVLSIFSNKYTLKSLMVIFTIIGASTSYFSFKLGIIFDDVMILNMISTDVAEAEGLMTIELMMLIFVLVIFTYLIFKYQIRFAGIKEESISKLIILGLSPVLMIAMILANSATFASFIREHKEIRYFATPITPIYSAISLLKESYTESEVIGDMINPVPSAHISFLDSDKELVILIVGETVRSDHMYLNGYQKNTNPYTSKISNLVSYKNFSSCGTSTAISVPCMFSFEGRKNFRKNNIYKELNVLDTLVKAGVYVEWRDNNSSSKGVSDRIKTFNFRNDSINTFCDEECRDLGMLVDLKNIITLHNNEDILIVLHAMGSHGPEYYKRYPENFAIFQPECKSKDLQDCEIDEIVNAYDNSIVYSDYLISEAINLLKEYPGKDTRMLYISDHGESLGEFGLYLHGYPYQFAPDSQKNVAAITWADQNADIPFEMVNAVKDVHFSHDNLACSLLEIFEVSAEACTDIPSIFHK